MRMKMRRHVVVVIHADDDPEEAADLWHGMSLGCNWIIQPNESCAALRAAGVHEGLSPQVYLNCRATATQSLFSAVAQTGSTMTDGISRSARDNPTLKGPARRTLRQR